MSDWDSKFNTWAKPPSQTETDRCDNAVTAIKKAIASSDALKTRNVTVFLQGSYYNKVNVKQNSDVDVGVCCSDTLVLDYPEGMTAEDFGIGKATYLPNHFRQDLHTALSEHFGVDEVTSGNKAFDIKSNTYRVEADVAPFFEHRRYLKNQTYHKGVSLINREGLSPIKNWPEQHNANGVSKNKATGKKYKQLVRVLKKLCLEMQKKDVYSAIFIPGFLCECLMWNVPNSLISDQTLFDGLRDAIAYLHDELGKNSSNKWREVSKLKYLFDPSQKWTKKQARDFLQDAWNHVGYE